MAMYNLGQIFKQTGVKKSKNQPFFFNIWGYVNRLGVALVQMVSDL